MEPQDPSHVLAQRLQQSVGAALLGKTGAVDLAITTLFAGGHLLIEDRPGVGKTLLARALARALDLPFQRLQCTADLLPSDVLGGMVYHPGTGELTFRPGPVFTSVLVADELNRTPPRTQSALLECMQERRVTIERRTMPLPDPFFVIATQNPLAVAGTYPLPENQLDRFLMRIRIGYPEPEDERQAVAREDGFEGLDAAPPVATAAELRTAREAVRAVRVAPELVAHVVELAHRTRTHPHVRTGVSTRGAQALHRACRARAVVHGRDYVVPDDVQQLAVPVFAHRLGARGDGAAETILRELLQLVPGPL
jgi:MoxR-like ATPase